MGDAPPPDKDLSALSASLQSDARDSTVFFGVLCTALEDALPASTTVERRHQPDPVPAAPVAAARSPRDDRAAQPRGVPSGARGPSVGDGLPYSKGLHVDEWTAALVAALAHDADVTAAATAALRSLTT